VPLAGYGNAAKQARQPSRSIFVAYLLAIALAEYVTTALDARWGLVLHGALIPDDRRRALLWALAIAPLLRIVSLSLPLGGVPIVYWYAAVSLPVLAAVAATARALEYAPRDLGLVRGASSALVALGCIVVGFALGLVEYRILAPAPLAGSPSLADVWVPAAILAVSTGFEEELVFRGLLQRAATEALGPVSGVAYATAVFATLHIGYLSVTDLAFVFVVGLLLGVLARRTRSLLAPTLLHAGINVSLFLVAPFLLTAAAMRV